MLIKAVKFFTALNCLCVMIFLMIYGDVADFVLPMGLPVPVNYMP